MCLGWKAQLWTPFKQSAVCVGRRGIAILPLRQRKLVPLSEWGEWAKTVPHKFVRLDKEVERSDATFLVDGLMDAGAPRIQTVLESDFPRSDDRVALVISTAVHHLQSSADLEGAAELLKLLMAENRLEEAMEQLTDISQALEFADMKTVLIFAETLEKILNQQYERDIPKKSQHFVSASQCDPVSQRTDKQRCWRQGPKGWTSAMDDLVRRACNEKKRLEEEFSDQQFEGFTRLVRSAARFFYVASPLTLLDPLGVLCMKELNSLFTTSLRRLVVTSSPGTLDGVVTLTEAFALREAFVNNLDAHCKEQERKQECFSFKINVPDRKSVV